MRPKVERNRNTSHRDRQLKSKSSATINFPLPGVLFHRTIPAFILQLSLHEALRVRIAASKHVVRTGTLPTRGEAKCQI